ncbi:hypothetical protein KM043_014408 [Ampulex compressa]|nr:hypothetical protein KM043_014408 [Ampulex compressa]
MSHLENHTIKGYALKVRMAETADRPKWLSELENRKRKTRLAHEAGAGAPCMVCSSACPGLDLHFWRKICKNCKCNRDDHDVDDDEFPQFDLLFGQSGKFKKKPILLRVNDENHVEDAFEWIPPETTKELAVDYMKALPIEKLPIKGSSGAALRRQLLQRQLPLHDIDHKACDGLTDQEKKQFEMYVENIKKCVGQGKVTKILSARPFDRSLMTPANATDMQRFSPQHKPYTPIQLRTPSSFTPKSQYKKHSCESQNKQDPISDEQTKGNHKTSKTTCCPEKYETLDILGNNMITKSEPMNTLHPNFSSQHKFLSPNKCNHHDESRDAPNTSTCQKCPNCNASTTFDALSKTLPSASGLQGSMDTIKDPVLSLAHSQKIDSKNPSILESMQADELLSSNPLQPTDIIGSTLDKKRLMFIREKLMDKYAIHGTVKTDPKDKAEIGQVGSKSVNAGKEVEVPLSQHFQSTSINAPMFNSGNDEGRMSHLANNIPTIIQDPGTVTKQISSSLQPTLSTNTNSLQPELNSSRIQPTVLHSEDLQNQVFPHKAVGTSNQLMQHVPNVEQIKGAMEDLMIESTKPENCHKCQEEIRIGDVAVVTEKAKNTFWHPGCFTCTVCNELLVDLIYFHYKNKLYCGRDLAKLLGIPRCFACDELIFVREYTVAEGHNYHVKHFCCWDCDVPLAGQQYITENDRPLCLLCYQKSYAKTCLACDKVIAADQQENLGKRPREDLLEDEQVILPNKKQRLSSDEQLADPIKGENNVASEVNGNMKNLENQSTEDKGDGEDKSFVESGDSKSNGIDNEEFLAEENTETISNTNEITLQKMNDDEYKDSGVSEELATNADTASTTDDDQNDKTSKENSIKKITHKSENKDPEVVDGLELSVECASDKEQSSSSDEEKDVKARPKTIIVKAEPNDSELDVSSSEVEKSDSQHATEVVEAKQNIKKIKRKGPRTSFSKVKSSGSDDSEDNVSDEDYSPRSKKKLKKSPASKKTAKSSPDTKRGRGRGVKGGTQKANEKKKPEKKVTERKMEQNDTESADDTLNSKKVEQESHSDSLMSNSDRENEDNDDTAKGTKRKRRDVKPDDDKRIQSLKKYIRAAGINIKSYNDVWSGCKTNAARVRCLRELLEKHGITGRPTLEKCKKVKKHNERLKDVSELDTSNIISEGRVTRARRDKDANQNNPDSRNEKSTLYRQIYSRITACGPITVADYMKEILTHPTAGYYMSKDVFGHQGDFTTSPEITQLFGEMIAVWMVNEWRKIAPDPVQIIELGPGRGTLMKDILRVLKKLRILNEISVHLVEISPILSKIQAQTLCPSSEECDLKASEGQNNSVTHYRMGVTDDGVKIYWYYSVQDVPKSFSIFLAHEFLDALPIHKFQKTNEGWREVLVDINPETNQELFRFVLSRTNTPACQIYVPKDECRDHIEISPSSMVTVDYITQFLWENGGFALFIDYGHNGEKMDTFRAFCRHKLHDPLLNPGSADLTADVDFSLIKKIAEKDDRMVTFGPITQRDFLKNLGIDVRLQRLLKSASDEQKHHIEHGYHMITDVDKMGQRFKVLSIFPFVLKDHLQKWPVAGYPLEKKSVM